MKPALCKLLLQYYDTAEAWRMTMFIHNIPDRPKDRAAPARQARLAQAIARLSQKLTNLSRRIDKLRKDRK